MSPPLDTAAREIGDVCLTLRPDLEFSPRLEGGEWFYVVEDRLHSRFFRLGRAEYQLVAQFDGQTPLHVALQRLATLHPAHGLSESAAAGLARWLLEMDLAHTEESSTAARLTRHATAAERQRWWSQFHPLSFRIPLGGSPDAFLARLEQRLGWVFSPGAFLAWLVLLAVGGYRVAANWDRFAASTQQIFAPENWFWLAACWTALKVVHELGHGLACRRYGGTVREAGILVLLLAPLAYVDVTTSWRLRSRRQRMVVAAAGMYVELACAAVAACVWSELDSGWLSYLCFQGVILTGFTTVLFNANPLLKFDGYYLLSDALGLPNLYTNGQWYVRHLARKWLLGIDDVLPAWRGWRGLFIRLYGCASLIWRIVVSCGLAAAAATLGRGAGVVLAALALLCWIGIPLARFLTGLGQQPAAQRPQWRRLATVTALVVIVVSLLCGYVPWPGSCVAPGIVEYSPPTVVRTRCAGLVHTLTVAEGEEVAAGQLLAVLENADLQRELQDLELQIRQCIVRERQHEQQQQLAARQAERERRRGLETQWQEKQAQVAQLEIHAPCHGWVVRRGLSQLLGTYLSAGEELLTLGNEREKEIRVALAQEDWEAFQRQQGKPVRVDVPGQRRWHATLQEVQPRATLQPLHPALIAPHGGPLPVTPVAHTDAREGGEYQLLSPRFTAVVPLSPATSQTVRAGQRVEVSFRPCHLTVGAYLYEQAAIWLRRHLTPQPASARQGVGTTASGPADARERTAAGRARRS